MSKKNNGFGFLLLGIFTLLALMANISLGSVSIPLGEIVKALTGGDVAKEAWRYIITDYRLPKAITAILTGSGLAVSGLMMQTLFKNPLAGPFVLGISSGASLGVALFILGAGVMGFTAVTTGSWGLVLAASFGSFLVLAVVIMVAMHIRDAMALLIIGLMFGSLTGAVVSILAYFSPAAELQRYIFWSFGSLGDISWKGIGILTLCYAIGLTLAVFSIKDLNSLLLGDAYAKTMGMRLKRSRLLIILSTSILAGSLTAFTGPIAFIGLAVPHFIRMVFSTSNHWILLPACLLGGALVMLICDSIAQLPMSASTLPINAVTSLVGAPVVIWLLLRKKKLLF